MTEPPPAEGLGSVNVQDDYKQSETYPNAHIQCPRLDHENEDFLRFGCGSALANGRSYSPPMLPAGHSVSSHTAASRYMKKRATFE